MMANLVCGMKANVKSGSSPSYCCANVLTQMQCLLFPKKVYFYSVGFSV